MSMNQLHTELLKVIALGKSNQNSVIRRLEKLYEEFGSLNMQKWRNTSNKSNSLLHESVDREMPEVIQHLVEVRKFDIDVRRGSDGLTPLQLASENQNSEITALLVQLGAGDIQTEDVSTWLSDDDKKKALNIVWVDLEMTSLEDPDIIECAVIITDKDLHVLDESKYFWRMDKLIFLYFKRIGSFILNDLTWIRLNNGIRRRSLILIKKEMVYLLIL